MAHDQVGTSTYNLIQPTLEIAGCRACDVKMYVSNEEENYRNLGTLLLNIATPAVEDIFRERNQALLPNSRWDHVPGIASNFFKVLCISKEGNLMYNKVMTIDQKNKLKNDDVSAWDLTLLYIVLKNIDYSHQSERIAADHDKENICVQNVKDIRNKYAHFSEGRISQKKFDKWWQVAEEALISLKVSAATIKEVKESGVVKHFRNNDLPPVHCIPRPDILRNLHAQLRACSTKYSLKERTVLICGVDGIGKTELVRMYVSTYQKDPIIQMNVAWINAEELPSLEASFVNLAKSGKLLTDKKGVSEITKNIFKHFSNHMQAGIFIFDNLYNVDQSFKILDYLPKPPLDLDLDQCRYPLILITTRDRDWASENNVSPCNVINVPEFTKTELLKLLSKMFRLKSDQRNHEENVKAIEKLAHALEGNPVGQVLTKIEKFAQKTNEPQESWAQNEETSVVAETPKYDLIMTNVYEVTLEKIKGLEQLGADANALLNFIAYLPTDNIFVDQLKEFLAFAFGTFSLEEPLRVIEQHGLVSVHIATHSYRWREIINKISVEPLLQSWTRDRLFREHDFSCISQVCNYINSYNFGENDGSSLFALRNVIWIHDILKENNWPNDSVPCSVMFCADLARYTRNFTYAWEIAADVYDVFEKKEAFHSRFQTRTEEENVVLDLFLLCVYRVHWTGVNSYDESSRHGYQHKMWKHPELSKDKLDVLLMSLIAPSMEHAILPKLGITPAQKHYYQLTFATIVELYGNCFFEHLEKSLVEQMSSTILSTVNSTFGCSLDSIRSIYRILWNYFKCKRNPNPEGFLKAVCRKHFEVFPTLKCGSDQEGTKRYWNNEAPIHFKAIDLYFNDLRDPTEGRVIMEAFFDNNGIQIISQYLLFLSQPCIEITYRDVEVLFFIHRVSYIWDSAEKFIQAAEFLEAFYKFTVKLTTGKRQPGWRSDCSLEKIICSVAWFGLFSKHIPCRNSTIVPGFTIDSVFKELIMMIDQIHHTGWNRSWKNVGQSWNREESHEHRWYTKDITGDFLNLFLETYKNESDCLAVEPATRFSAFLRKHVPPPRIVDS